MVTVREREVRFERQALVLTRDGVCLGADGLGEFVKPEGPGLHGRGGRRGQEAEQDERQHGAIIACSPCVSVARHFLLSPANCGGRRAQQLLSDRAASPFADHLQSAEGAPLGDVFAFMSGLYLQGKLAYARRFARGGLDERGRAHHHARYRARAARHAGDRARVLRFADTSVDADNDAFTRPLVQAACRLHNAIAEHADVVLLGSIASPKYVSPLLDCSADGCCSHSNSSGGGT